MGPPTKASVPPSVIFQHRERLLHLSLTLVGQKVVLHQTNGAIVEGIFHTFTPFPSLPADQRNKYVLKEIFMRQQPENESAIKDGITLIIPASKVVFLHAVGIAAELKDSNNMNGASIGLGDGAPSKGGFATDTQISGSAASGRTNELVAAGNAWTAGGNSNGSSSYRNQALGSGGLQATNSRAAALAGNKKGDASAAASDVTGGKISGSIGQWDQFKANKELFNVNATFDENLYTTQLDTSQLDAKKMAEAERIAKEIENTATKNIHMAEERGFKVETDFDEEDLYSGVLTKDGKQRHEKVTISKKTGTEKESKDASKTTTAVPKKVMNYAAAAAKADANKNKSAPPGFSSNGAPTPAVKDNEKDAESSTPVVTPEKDAKEDAKVAEKSASSKESTSAAKDVEEKAETATKSEKDESSSKDKDASKDKTSEPSASESEKTAEAKDKATEKKTEKKDVKKTSKLNANAKSFTFNPSAKTFTPSFTPGATSNPPPQPPQAATADPGMVYGGVHAMQPPHYLQTGPMGQPGMMPIMNPQYPGMRYTPYNGMEQPMSQMQHQAPHVQVQTTPVPSAPSSGNAPTPTPGSGPSNTSVSNDDQGQQQREEDASQTPAQAGGQQQQPQRAQQQQSDQNVHSQGPPQQQQIPMPYNVPPNAYFSAGMAMPPRGPGYPQFVAGGPQQIPGRPGVPPYAMYPMQQGGMPQNMQMRGPNGNPYYPPNAPMPYPPGGHMGYPMMDDGGRGRGGRSSNGGRGGRGRGGRGGRGRGRSNYNNTGKTSQQQYNNHQSQQHQPSASQQQGQSGNGSSNKSD